MIAESDKTEAKVTFTLSHSQITENTIVEQYSGWPAGKVNRRGLYGLGYAHMLMWLVWTTPTST